MILFNLPTKVSMTSIRAAMATIDIIRCPGTLQCIEGDHGGLIMYHMNGVASHWTPSTDESHFSYDVTRHPNYSSKSGTL
jgi:hypothetical protein